MGEQKKATRFSSSIGNKWHGEKPDVRRKKNTDKKGKK